MRFAFVLALTLLSTDSFAGDRLRFQWLKWRDSSRECAARIVDKATGRVGSSYDLSKKYFAHDSFGSFFDRFRWRYGYQLRKRNMAEPVDTTVRGYWGHPIMGPSGLRFFYHPDKGTSGFSGKLTLIWIAEPGDDAEVIARRRQELLPLLENHFRAVHAANPGPHLLLQRQPHGLYAELGDSTVLRVFSAGGSGDEFEEGTGRRRAILYFNVTPGPGMTFASYVETYKLLYAVLCYRWIQQQGS